MTSPDTLQQSPQEFNQPEVDSKERAGVILDAVKSYKDSPKVNLAVSRNISELRSRGRGEYEQFTDDEIKLYFAAIDYGYDALRQSDAPDRQTLIDMTIAHQTVFASCLPLIERQVKNRIYTTDQEDVIQNAIIATHDTIPRYTHTTKIYPLVSGITAHKIADHFRKNASKQPELEFEDVFTDRNREIIAPDIAEEVANRVDDNPIADAVRQALETHADSFQKRETFLRQIAVVCLRNGIDLAGIEGLDDFELNGTGVRFADAIKAMPPKGYAAEDVATLFGSTSNAIRVSDHRTTAKLRDALSRLSDSNSIQV